MLAPTVVEPRCWASRAGPIAAISASKPTVCTIFNRTGESDALKCKHVHLIFTLVTKTGDEISLAYESKFGTWYMEMATWSSNTIQCVQ